MPRIDAFLKLGTTQACSDVHLAVGVPPMLRMNGELVAIRFRDLGEAELESYINEILSRNLSERFRGGPPRMTRFPGHRVLRRGVPAARRQDRKRQTPRRPHLTRRDTPGGLLAHRDARLFDEDLCRDI